MKHAIKTFLLAGLICAGTSYADSHNNDDWGYKDQNHNNNGWDNDCYREPTCCPDPCCDGPWSVGLDLLFWEPCITSNNEWKVENISAGSVKSKHHEPDWEFGFRLHLGKECAWRDWDITAQYTFINSDSDLNITVDNVNTRLRPTVAGSTVLKESRELDYHQWDIMWSKTFRLSPCHYFTPAYGMTGLYLDQSVNTHITATNNVSYHWEGDYLGWGARLGANYRYDINSCMSFHMFGTTALTFGEADTSWNNTVGSSATQHGKSDFCTCVPGLHIGSSMQCDGCWCGMMYNIRLGYEYLHWFNVPHAIGVNQAGFSEISESAGDHIGFHGIVLGLGVRF